LLVSHDERLPILDWAASGRLFPTFRLIPEANPKGPILKNDSQPHALALRQKPPPALATPDRNRFA
jgi:hypothetical protein